MKISIPEISIEIGENLYLKIVDVEYTPSRPAYTSGRPEDCYEGESSELEWRASYLEKSRAVLLNPAEALAGAVREYKFTYVEYKVEEEFANVHYDLLIEEVEHKVQEFYDTHNKA